MGRFDCSQRLGKGNIFVANPFMLFFANNGRNADPMLADLNDLATVADR